jgi:hypothetical protein
MPAKAWSGVCPGTTNRALEGPGLLARIKRSRRETSSAASASSRVHARVSPVERQTTGLDEQQ